MADNPRPPILYKFRDWSNEQHKTVLTERKLWVPCATKLNDPFDCCIPFRYDLMPRADLVQRLIGLLTKHSPGKSIATMEKEAELKIDELGIYDPARNTEVLEGFAQSYQRNYGILSFAGGYDDPLLWSHYADCYRGFCLGIDSGQLKTMLNKRFVETGLTYAEALIRYYEKYPEIIPKQDEDEDDEMFKKLLTTKSSAWKYEREYRFVFAKAFDFALELGESSVSVVILGSEMPDKDRDSIARIVEEQYPKARILQARRKSVSFELEFVPRTENQVR